MQITISTLFIYNILLLRSARRYCRQSRIGSARGTDKTIIISIFFFLSILSTPIMIIIISFPPLFATVSLIVVYTLLKSNRLRRRLMDANWSSADAAADVWVDRRDVYCHRPLFPSHDKSCAFTAAAAAAAVAHTRARARVLPPPSPPLSKYKHTADDHRGSCCSCRHDCTTLTFQ